MLYTYREAKAIKDPMGKIKNQYCGSMYCSYGYSIFLGNMPAPKLHSHHVTEILIGNKKPVNLITENNTCYEENVLLVGPDVLHTATEIEKEMIIIVLDPELELSLKITSKYLGKKDVVPLPVKRDIEAINLYFNDPTVENAVKVYTSFINSLELTDTNIQKDSRIMEAVRYIRNLDVKKASTKEIAEHVGLSEGRLTHLFKEQVGIPIRRYLIWRRINDAIYALLKGKSLTYAAHEAEFADYAHLSRNFSNMFGYPISEIIKYTKFFTVETTP